MQRLVLAEDSVFSIHFTADRCLVDFVMRKFWTVADARRFEAAVRQAMADIAAKGGTVDRRVSLFDATDFPVQSQDVVMCIAPMVLDPTLQSRKVAILLSSALLRNQARRTAPNYSIFENRVSAMAWLIADVAAA